MSFDEGLEQAVVLCVKIVGATPAMSVIFAPYTPLKADPCTTLHQTPIRSG
jgi:hypothetical protein